MRIARTGTLFMALTLCALVPCWLVAAQPARSQDIVSEPMPPVDAQPPAAGAPAEPAPASPALIDPILQFPPPGSTVLGEPPARGEVLPWASPQGPPATIEWRVKNPFRLFSDPKDTGVHRDVHEQLTAAEKLEPILSAERRLMQIYRNGWARDMVANTCWRPERNRYGPCPDGEDYINPAEHIIVARLGGRDLSQDVCTWVVTPYGEASEARTFLEPCAEAVDLSIPYPKGARVTVQKSGAPDAIVETDIAVQDVFIAGMGDSFAAGEGNPDRPTEFSRTRDVSYGSAPDGSALDGYPARTGDWQDIGDGKFLDAGPRWMSQACHRSLYSYQARVALQLAVENPHRAVTFVSFACAGAEVTAGLLLRYKGTEWAPDQPDKPQISAVARAQCGRTEAPEKSYQNTYSLNGKLPDLENITLATCPRGKARRIDLLLLSVGGNDVGFARLVANTILANEGTLRALSGWMGQVQTAEELIAAIPNLELRYKALNRAIHLHLQMPWTESDRIILTAYPMMAVQDTSGGVCPDGQTGMNVFPEFQLSQTKAAAGEKASERLNTMMRRVAKEFSWSFVERHRPEFAGHGICSGLDGTAINLGDETRIPRKTAGGWQPFNPGDFQAYTSRQRWFRTPNDAYMTGNYHIATNIVKTVMSLQQWEYFQLVLASTYSGAFHPSSEGQAVMADATLVRARTVLDRYAARDRIRLTGRGDQ